MANINSVNGIALGGQTADVTPERLNAFNDKYGTYANKTSHPDDMEMFRVDAGGQNNVQQVVPRKVSWFDKIVRFFKYMFSTDTTMKATSRAFFDDVSRMFNGKIPPNVKNAMGKHCKDGVEKPVLLSQVRLIQSLASQALAKQNLNRRTTDARNAGPQQQIEEDENVDGQNHNPQQIGEDENVDDDNYTDLFKDDDNNDSKVTDDDIAEYLENMDQLEDKHKIALVEVLLAKAGKTDLAKKEMDWLWGLWTNHQLLTDEQRGLVHTAKLEYDADHMTPEEAKEKLDDEKIVHTRTDDRNMVIHQDEGSLKEKLSNRGQNVSSNTILRNYSTVSGSNKENAQFTSNFNARFNIQFSDKGGGGNVQKTQKKEEEVPSDESYNKYVKGLRSERKKLRSEQKDIIQSTKKISNQNGSEADYNILRLDESTGNLYVDVGVALEAVKAGGPSNEATQQGKVSSAVNILQRLYGESLRLPGADYQIHLLNASEGKKILKFFTEGNRSENEFRALMAKMLKGGSTEVVMDMKVASQAAVRLGIVRDVLLAYVFGVKVK